MVDDEHSANSTDSDPQPTRANAYVGQILGDRYRVVRPLGAGGMGMVLLARHTILKKLVAIKVIDCSQIAGADAASRLFREAQAAAATGHPNIIDVIDVGVSTLGDPYLVMEYLDGEDLSSIVAREGPMAVAGACAVLEPVLLALAAAHEHGIVHRDVKPQNIFVARKAGGEFQVKLIDFGVAKVTTPGLSPLTRSGQVLGTPSFMSPEQAKGAEVDTRSDIYSVGVILHHLLTGKTPYGEANYHALLHRIATGEPTLATDDLDPYLGSVIRHCMEREPAARPQTAADLLKALERVNEWEKRGSALRAIGEQLLLPPVVTPLEFEEDRPSQLVSSSAPAGFIRSIAPEAVASRSQGLGLEATMATPGASAAPPPRNVDRRANWSAIGMVAVVSVSVGLWYGVHLVRDAEPHRSQPAPLTVAAPTPLATLDETPELEPLAIAPDAPKTVEIRVEGIPEEASITVEGQPVLANPFRVNYSKTPVTIRAERSGYVPTQAQIVPDQDRVIHARLAPRKETTSRAQTLTPASASGEELKPAPTMGRSGRDSHYYEQFE